MKYAIVTFYESTNYGTVLQAYALQKKLDDIGCKNELLHIVRDVHARNAIKEQPRRYTIFQRLLSKLNDQSAQIKDEKKKRNFEEFREKHLTVSENAYETDKDYAQVKAIYDGFVCGSDQIWNPYHKVFSERYLLDFAPPESLKVSFSSSFGVSEIKDVPQYEKIKELLSRFQIVSVREQSGVDIIERMGLPKPKLFLDPVFLLTKQEWLGLIPVRRKSCNERYILVYALVEVSETVKKYIKNYAKMHRCRIKIIPNNYANRQNFFDKPFESGPVEFLSLINNAYCIFTNSFHGAAFSILFNKQFYGFIGDSENARIRSARLTDLFKTFGVEHRLLCIENMQNASETQIDYFEINRRIENNRQKAIKFLYDSLINETKAIVTKEEQP